MTLLETERLARKLAAAVNKAPEAAVALKLAEDFASVCRAVNLRLRQCEAMLNSGDVPQALQLAEAAPSLLDLITLLEFRESDTWRAYCHANRLPAAEPLDSRAVHRLNEAYAKGISTEDPLYRRYRKAVLMKNEEEARAVLRSITRLNPSDMNAATERARLDDKVLSEKLAVLSHAIDAATPAQVTHLVEAVEAGNFQSLPNGSEWRRAQRVRSAHLLALAEESRRGEDWRKALSHLELVQNLESECEFQLSPEEKKRFVPLKQWADAGLKRHLQDQEFAKHLTELTRLLTANEEKDTMARAVPLDEMKADYEGLHRVWRGIQDLARVVPEELNTRFRKRSSMLETEISRRTRRRVQAVAAAVAALLLAGGLAVWWGLTQFRARDFAAQLAAAEQSRQLRTAEKLIERIKGSEQRLLGVGALNVALAKAESFTNRERDLLKAFEDAFATLPENPAPGLSIAQIAATQKQFENAKELFAKIASDAQAEQQPRLTAFQNKWERTLAAESATLNADYETKLKRLEQDTPRLDYRADVEQTRRLLAGLSPLLAQLRETEGLFASNVTVRADLRQRRELAGTRVAAFEKELRGFDEAAKAMQQAKVFRDFATALEQLARSEFSASPLVATAKTRRVAELSDEALLQSLLCRSNAALAAYFKTYAQDKFVPSAAMPAEVSLVREIEAAAATGASLFRYRFTIRGVGGSALELLTAGQLGKAAVWQKIQAYKPADSPSRFLLRQTEYGFFKGQYRLSPTELLQSVEEIGACSETACAGELGLDSLLASEAWRRPLLQVLDEVKGTTKGSPLFRAYVFTKLMDVMELQPESWGLAFCPAARAHREELRQLTGLLQDGDWFAPTPAARLSKPLEDFFQSVRQVSYWKQAQALAAVARQTWESGVRLAGYVDVDGQPRLAGASAPTELWGFDSEKSPALVFRSNAGHLTPLRQPLTLSPLFALAQERSALLSRAGVNPKDKLFAGHLPPLFADLAEAK